MATLCRRSLEKHKKTYVHKENVNYVTERKESDFLY